MRVLLTLMAIGSALTLGVLAIREAISDDHRVNTGSEWLAVVAGTILIVALCTLIWWAGIAWDARHERRRP